MRGMLRKSDAYSAKDRTPRSVRLGEGRRVGGGERGGRGRALGVVLCQRSSFKPVPGSNQFNFQERWGWTFLFLLSTQLRYGKNMRIVVLKVLSMCLIPTGWSCSWRIVRKVRTVQTFSGSGCRGGHGGKLHRICKERANISLNFSSLPPDSVPRPGFWNIFFGFILYR